MSTSSAMISFACLLAACAAHRPSGRTSGAPGGAVPFSAAGFDELHDLHGDVADPDLVIFMGGNEFMVLPDLLPAFRRATPACGRIFVETLPPGILDAQLREGALQVGSLRIDHRPDVFTAGRERMEQLARENRVERPVPYASNRLALLVAEGNPLHIEGLADLGRPGVRVSTPDAGIEDIGKKVKEALRQAGGDTLVRQVLERKVGAGETHVTRIHHRETPSRLLDGRSDVGPVWRTEGLHQQRLEQPLQLVEIADAPRSTSAAAVVRGTGRRACAEAFVAFLASEPGLEILARHGFQPPAGE